MSSEFNKDIIKVWMDGCFDLVHFGHADACRQAKLKGHILIVGIHSDAEITKNKGNPVTKEEERYKLMRAIKWVDDVVENAPYVPTIETLNKYQCDFCVHGEELAVGIDGTDYHEPVRKAGRYKDLIRTIPISTTNLITRMLKICNENEESIGIPGDHDVYLRLLKEKIDQFSNSHQPKCGDCIVYAPGVYDLLHIGHIDFLQKAKAVGDYLIVGVYSDENVRTHRKNSQMIMNVYERSLSLLACRSVDRVILNPPYSIDEDFLNQFQIGLVVHGLRSRHACTDDRDPFQVPKNLNKFQTIDSGNTFTKDDIIQRVLRNRTEYEARNAKKEADEIEGYKQYMAKLKS